MYPLNPKVQLGDFLLKPVVASSCVFFVKLSLVDLWRSIFQMSSEFFFVPKTLPERNHHKTWSPEAMENNKTGWTMLNRDCSENLKCVVFFNINFPVFFPKPRFFLCKELRENPQKFKKIWRCHPNKSENPPSLRFKVQKSAPYINHRLQVWGSSFHPGFFTLFHRVLCFFSFQKEAIIELTNENQPEVHIFFWLLVGFMFWTLGVDGGPNHQLLMQIIR